MSKDDDTTQRGELVHVGDIPLDAPGVSRTLTARRQAHHFTTLDQVMQLVAARDADPEMGFMARLLALCSLPRTNQGKRLQFKRENGPFTLYMTAGAGNKLPYGTLPRLLLAWLCTEAVRTRSRELVLGDSFAAFMRKLVIHNDDGRTRRRLQEQMRRLFGCMVSLTYKDATADRFVNSLIADSGEYWWDVKQPDQSSLWESKIVLGERFFYEVITNPVPLDMHVLRAVRRSPLGLDLYLWLTYRTFHLKAPLRLTWPQLYRQFGADPARAGDTNTVNAFRTDCLRELGKIQRAWPNLNCRTVKGRLVVAPSRPRIAPAQLTLREE